MSQNSSNTATVRNGRIVRLLEVIGLPLWVFLGFALAQVLLFAGLSVITLLGAAPETFEGPVFETVTLAAVYALAVLIVVGGPWLALHRRPTKEDLGLSRLPEWLDLLWAPAGYITYIIASVLVMALATSVLTFIDFEQVQDVGFAGLSQRYEYLLAFVSLVVIAPLAEEILFRGYLLSELRRRTKTWIAILLTSLMFGVVHLAWNVGIDVFVLSIVLCVLRIKTGSLWASVLLHMIKNAVAYYFLFISPFMTGTL